ncbi:MAG: hypothetical protein GIKADHBN_00058 [Phycisphaerales bacterium]|nr:hypothetical protein [Phycisphaerales bacterium]
MKSRLRTLLILAGSLTAVGAAWPTLNAVAGPADPNALLRATEPPADGHDDHAAKSTGGHDDASHEDDHATEPPRGKTPAKDNQGDHEEPVARKPAKNAKSADPSPRKPLFGDKSADKKEAPAPEEEGVLSADRALELLQEGNQRWATGDTRNPSSDPDRRRSTADKGQQPFVTVLTCADSRIPVERLFDRGVGEIFTVRVAGNIAATAETGTIEYGVEHLHTPLLVVMGHTKCGAVAAAASGQPLPGNIGQLVAAITPAVERVKKAQPDADPQAIAAASVKENVWQSIFDLYRSSAPLRDMAREGKLKVVGAIYDIATGKVEWLGEHPWQSQILDALHVQTASTPADHE